MIHDLWAIIYEPMDGDAPASEQLLEGPNGLPSNLPGLAEREFALLKQVDGKFAL